MQDEAFTSLYRKYANFVYSIALSYMKNPADAEDVTADVFVRLLETDISFPDETHARAWLATVVRNRCKNLLRHWLRRKREAEEVMEQIPVSDRAADVQQVMQALLALPEKYRLPLLLFAVEGYSVRETADILHLNESTVRTRIARAREMIRKETGVDNA
ncbi:MAG: sigma-70 family RNA polymerase sigma factor [Oscillospiraceae bacterium]|nr:sigma-70 family RNA polymerase sigma factor [Oscillospiraceae bacterium]MBQ9906250.1 sigma-70 family RNA polymerase sigma factor [Oscillospiraceae bacterium]